MTRNLSLFLASVLAVGSGVAANGEEQSPSKWVERCLAKTKSGMDWVSRREECMGVILVYCRHATEPQSCFADITVQFQEKIQRLLAGLPDTVQGTPLQMNNYKQRLRILRNTSTASCVEANSECAAFQALRTYHASASLAGWLAKLEDEE